MGREDGMMFWTRGRNNMCAVRRMAASCLFHAWRRFDRRTVDLFRWAPIV